MPLQTSGPISLADVNVELARSSTQSINMDEYAVRELAGALPPVIFGFPLSYGMADFYGKSRSVPINWQVYGGGAGGGTGYTYSSVAPGGGGGAAGVRVRSSGGAIQFNPGQWYTVIIGAGGAGAAPLSDPYGGGNNGTYSAIDSAGTMYYTTHDTTTSGLVSGGGKNGGYYLDEFQNQIISSGYGGRGGSSYFWGQAVEYRGIEPTLSYLLGGGGGGASYNNGPVGYSQSDGSNTYGAGGNGAVQLTTTSIEGFNNFGGGGGGGAGGYNPPSDYYVNPGTGGNAHGGSGGTAYYSSYSEGWIQVPTGDAVVNTGSGGGGGAGMNSYAYGFSTVARGGNGSSGVVYIQYPSSFPNLVYTGNYDVPFTASGYKTYRLTSSGQFKVG